MRGKKIKINIFSTSLLLVYLAQNMCFVNFAREISMLDVF